MENSTMQYPGGEYIVEDLQPFGAAIRAPAPRLSARSVPVDLLRSLARERHLVLLRGFLPFSDGEDLADYGSSWGEIMMWPFGAVLELVEEPDAVDHIFGNCSIPMHWDGMYREFVPEFQIFSCVTTPPAGATGRTLFANTISILSESAPDDRARWAHTTITYEVEKVSHYGGRISSRLLAENPQNNAPIIRFNEPPPRSERFPNPHTLILHGVHGEEASGVVDELTASLYGKRYCYAHEWQDGDLLIADNYTLLHGREAFVAGSPRHLRRVHILGVPPLENPANQG